MSSHKNKILISRRVSCIFPRVFFSKLLTGGIMREAGCPYRRPIPDKRCFLPNSPLTSISLSQSISTAIILFYGLASRWAHVYAHTEIALYLISYFFTRCRSIKKFFNQTNENGVVASDGHGISKLYKPY
jgi:hypothetical protein